jgi:hypothetical protein
MCGDYHTEQWNLKVCELDLVNKAESKLNRFIGLQSASSYLRRNIKRSTENTKVTKKQHLEKVDRNKTETQGKEYLVDMTVNIESSK